jgi:hypothetical protein
MHWIVLTETPTSVAMALIHGLLATATDRIQEALPASRDEDQGTGCTCPLSR